MCNFFAKYLFIINTDLSVGKKLGSDVKLACSKSASYKALVEPTTDIEERY